MTTQSFIEKLKIVLKHPLEFSACTILVSLVVITMCQVIWRYVFRDSLSWSEELARFLLIWLTMLAAAYGVKSRTHFALNLLVNKFNEKAQRIVQLVILVITVCFLVTFTYQALIYTLAAANTYAPALQISMAIPYSSSVFGGALMTYYVLKNGLQDITNPSTSKQQ